MSSVLIIGADHSNIMNALVTNYISMVIAKRTGKFDRYDVHIRAHRHSTMPTHCLPHRHTVPTQWPHRHTCTIPVHTNRKPQDNSELKIELSHEKKGYTEGLASHINDSYSNHTCTGTQYSYSNHTCTYTQQNNSTRPLQCN